MGNGDAPRAGGLYILWLHLPRSAVIRVGALGEVTLPPGLYAYVGTAQRHRAARLARHLRVDKPLRWHIDYLRPHARVVRVSCIDGSRAGECALATRLAERLDGRRSVPGFGASDCRCGGHLIAFGPRRDLPSVADGCLDG